MPCIRPVSAPVSTDHDYAGNDESKYFNIIIHVNSERVSVVTTSDEVLSLILYRLFQTEIWNYDSIIVWLLLLRRRSCMRLSVTLLFWILPLPNLCIQLTSAPLDDDVMILKQKQNFNTTNKDNSLKFSQCKSRRLIFQTVIATDTTLLYVNFTSVDQ